MPPPLPVFNWLALTPPEVSYMPPEILVFAFAGLNEYGRGGWPAGLTFGFTGAFGFFGFEYPLAVRFLATLSCGPLSGLVSSTKGLSTLRELLALYWRLSLDLGLLAIHFHKESWHLLLAGHYRPLGLGVGFFTPGLGAAGRRLV